MLALSLGTIKYDDARPRLSPVPFTSVVNGSVTCRAIEVQILTQAAESILSFMFCKFLFDARNRWYALASVFRSRIAKEKKQENTSENSNESSI